MQPFPSFRDARGNPYASQKMQDLMDLITAIRSLRAEMNIDPRRSLDAVFAIPSAEDKGLILGNMQKIRTMARLNAVEFSDLPSGNLLRGVCRLGEFGLDVHDAINVASERDRMQKENKKIGDEIEKILKKLSNADFVARAPEAVVAENRARHEDLLDRQRKIESNLKRLPLN
jgi:valyl-tRNA synthetase